MALISIFARKRRVTLPLGTHVQAQQGAPGTLPTRKRERGMALILVLSLVGVILTVLAEILLQSQISVRTIIGERDKTKAELCALTGAQFAQLLISLDLQLADLTDDGNTKLPPQIKAIAKEMLGGLKQSLGGKNLGALLDGFPIGAESFDATGDLAKLGINALLDESLVNALKAVPGKFVLETSNESRKLNINSLGASAEKGLMLTALTRLFSTPNEAKFLEEKGFPPNKLAGAVKDYIDSDNNDEIDRSDETSQYERLGFKHKPKNGRLESLEELRRVPGFHDDEIYNLFTPYLTVWPLDAQGKSLDINQAAVELVSALMTKEGSEVNDAELDKLEDFRSKQQTFSKIQDVSQFFQNMTNPDPMAKNLLSGLTGMKTSVYRVVVHGYAQGSEAVYEMVLEATKPKAGSKEPPASPVRIVYQRFM